MPIINSIVSWFNESRMSKIDLMQKYPEQVQKETFAQLIDFAKNTEWGKKYDYKSIEKYSDYTSRFQVQDYENIKNDVSRIRNGEKDILWPGEIKWFAKSSGTTNDKSKFIPVSNESLEQTHFRGGKDVIAIYTNNFPETNVLTGKSLILGGSHQINNFNNQSFYGDLSAVVIENMPFWSKFLRAGNQETILMSDWNMKIEKMAEETIDKNIVNIAGVPSWTLVFLRYVLELKKTDNILDVWPNLELFIHGGVSFEPYKNQYKQIIANSNMNYMETYNASEGFFAIQTNPNSDDMLLMLDYGIFYEFIPMSEFGTENPKTLTISEVDLNVNYAIVISTNGGLWRYLIGDTVKFTSKYPFKIKITGRTKHFINAFGEELIIDNAEKAIKIACQRTNSTIKEYTAAPIYPQKDRKGGHEWIFEFEQKPNDINYFIDVLDTVLKSLNSDYEAKRYMNLSMDTPKVHIAPNGLFYTWLNNKGKLGGQNKVPRLSNNRTYIEELLILAETL